MILHGEEERIVAPETESERRSLGQQAVHDLRGERARSGQDEQPGVELPALKLGAGVDQGGLVALAGLPGDGHHPVRPARGVGHSGHGEEDPQLGRVEGALLGVPRQGELSERSAGVVRDQVRGHQVQRPELSRYLGVVAQDVFLLGPDF